MKLNQFGRLTPDVDEQFVELQKISLINESFKQNNVHNNLVSILRAFLPEYKTKSTKEIGFKRYLATESEDLFTFLTNEKNEITDQLFYDIVLQFLGFEVGKDFQLMDPFGFMDQTGLPYVHFTTFNNDYLLTATYLWLNTRSKAGSSFIDSLSSRGFFSTYIKAHEQNPELLVFNGKTQPVFDTTKIIREVVYVESPLDTDKDGALDLLEVTIFRPSETNKGFKAAALYTANPYFKGTNNVDAFLHDVDEDLTVITPGETEKAEPTIGNLPPKRKVVSESNEAEQVATTEGIYSLNDYFLARGFATVYAAGIGTQGSDGIRTCGSVAETVSTIAIIEWLAGNRVAYTNRTDNIEIKAWWCNESVAMTGKSYLGTLATAAATTGVAGLKTIISEAAISSWYDYYRENGLVIAPAECQGEDTDVLAELCFSREQDAGDYLKVKKVFDDEMAHLKVNQDRQTGNYSQFWDDRNYRKDVKNIKCDVVMVHGLNDWNVKPKNVEKLWGALRDVPVNKKLFLHQGKHIYLNNIRSLDFNDMMNLWLSYELYGVANGVTEQLPNVMIQDNTVPETWHRYQDWSRPHMATTLYHATDGKLQTTPPVKGEIAKFSDNGAALYRTVTQSASEWEATVVGDASAYATNRLIFKSEPMDKDQYIDGKIKITVQAAVDRPTGQLSAMVIDYGLDYRLNENPSVVMSKGIKLGYDWVSEDLKEFELAKEKSAYKMITKGHMGMQNPTSPALSVKLVPDEFNTYHFELQPTHYHLVKGHQLGLVIYATDMGMTKRPFDDAIYQIDLNATQLQVPFQR